MLHTLRKSPVYANWIPLIVVWLLLGTGCGAAPSSASIEAPVATAAAAANDAGLLDKPQGKLSATLARLAQPDVAAQSAQAQAEALAIPETGPGSLMRNEQGQVLVAVRVSDASVATEDVLRAAGATIVNSAPEFRTITLYISPEQLSALAALPGVENIREELRAS